MTQVAAVGMVIKELQRNLPGRLDQCLVLLTFQDLKKQDDNLESYIWINVNRQTTWNASVPKLKTERLEQSAKFVSYESVRK